MGGCATKLRQAFEVKGEKPEAPVEVEVEVEEDKMAAGGTEEQLMERVEEIVVQDEKQNEIAVVDEIQGCKQRPSLSLLFKQEEKDWAESEKPKSETKEPILEAQEPEPLRPKEEEEDQQRHHEPEMGRIIEEEEEEEEEQRDASEQTKSEEFVESSSP